MTGQRFRIPLEIIELDSMSCHILLQASIDDIPCNLIIDTGASRTVFDRNYLEDRLEIVGMKTEDLKTAGVLADEIETLVARTSSFSIADFTLADMQVLLIDLGGINSVYASVTGRNIHGLLGSDFLYRHGAVIDFGGKTMTLEGSVPA